jgi:hypothetical protein
MNAATELLKKILSEKYGTLTKIQMHADSFISLGDTIEGSFEVMEFEDKEGNVKPYILCGRGFNTIRTSPVQQILGVKNDHIDIVITFRTVTSVYEARVRK